MAHVAHQIALFHVDVHIVNNLEVYFCILEHLQTKNIIKYYICILIYLKNNNYLYKNDKILTGSIYVHYDFAYAFSRWFLTATTHLAIVGEARLILSVW